MALQIGGEFAYLAVVFFVLTVVAALVGFQGTAGISWDVARILVFVFVVLVIASLLVGGDAGAAAGLLVAAAPTRGGGNV